MKPEEMSEQALLEQLIEECGELVQSAAKRLRILRGESPTPVTLEENEKNLREELSDVELLIFIYGRKNVSSSLEIEMTKYKRWRERLNECVHEIPCKKNDH